jgi:hypothetical protein
MAERIIELQCLDGDLAPQARVTLDVNLTHPALPEKREDLVGSELRTGWNRH